MRFVCVLWATVLAVVHVIAPVAATTSNSSADLLNQVASQIELNLPTPVQLENSDSCTKRSRESEVLLQNLDKRVKLEPKLDPVQQVRMTVYFSLCECHMPSKLFLMNV